VRELNRSSSFVDHQPAHSWWFVRKSVRSRAEVLRLFACSLREGGLLFRHPRIIVVPSPSEFATPPPRCIQTAAPTEWVGQRYNTLTLVCCAVPRNGWNATSLPSPIMAPILPKSLIQSNLDIKYTGRCDLIDYKNSRGRKVGSPPTSS
jgi:hypothetical protein